MSGLLSSISGGIVRFALAWLLPTSIAVGLFWACCVPTLVDRGIAPTLTGAPGDGTFRGPVEGVGLAAFVTFSISVVLAYSSQLIYRVLEGYHLPPRAARVMTARQRLRKARMTAVVEALGAHPLGSNSSQYGLATEKLELYPQDDARLLPTRLGNALRSLESYGQRVYGLDSQQFWHELVGTAAEPVRQEQAEARAMVDIFVSGVAVFSGLTVIAGGVALLDPDRPAPIVLALVSAVLVPVSYRGAMRNMKEWRNSVRAMVNLGRFRVAENIGLQLPWTLDDERRMWESTSNVLHYVADPGSRAWLDVFRRGSPFTVEEGELIDGRPASTRSDVPPPAGTDGDGSSTATATNPVA